MEKEKIINVLPGKEYLVLEFINRVYGSPHMWGGGEGLIIRGYDNFSIEGKKEMFDKEYKMRIIYHNLDDKILKKLNYFAHSKKACSSDIEEMAKEIKDNCFMFEYKSMGAQA